MQPRLSDLTREISGQHRDVPMTKFIELMLRHNGRLDMAAAEAPRLIAPLDRIIKMATVPTGDTTTAGWASETVGFGSMSANWVAENERPTILAQLPYVPAPFLVPTGVEIGAPTATWVGQGRPIPMAKPTVGAVAPMQRTKIAVLISFSEDLFMATGAALLGNIRDAVSRAVNYGLDRAMIDPFLGPSVDGPQSLLYALTPTQSTGSSAAQILADMKALFSSFGSSLRRAVGVCAPSTALIFATLQDTLGVRVFPEMSAVGGNIWGVPFVVTDAASLVGSPGGKVVALLDGSKIVVADDGLITFAVSSVATAQFTDTPTAGAANQVSAFQTNVRILKALRYVNFARASTSAAAYFTVAY